MGNGNHGIAHYKDGFIEMGNTWLPHLMLFNSFGILVLFFSRQGTSMTKVTVCIAFKHAKIELVCNCITNSNAHVLFLSYCKNQSS